MTDKSATLPSDSEELHELSMTIATKKTEKMGDFLQRYSRFTHIAIGFTK